MILYKHELTNDSIELDEGKETEVRIKTNASHETRKLLASLPYSIKKVVHFKNGSTVKNLTYITFNDTFITILVEDDFTFGYRGEGASEFVKYLEEKGFDEIRKIIYDTKMANFSCLTIEKVTDVYESKSEKTFRKIN